MVRAAEDAEAGPTLTPIPFVNLITCSLTCAILLPVPLVELDELLSVFMWLRKTLIGILVINMLTMLTIQLQTPIVVNLH